jgi:hypothetical protein
LNSYDLTKGHQEISGNIVKINDLRELAFPSSSAMPSEKATETAGPENRTSAPQTLSNYPIPNFKEQAPQRR